MNAAGQLLYEPIPANRQALGAMAFPFVFPGAYSIPQTLTTAYGWIHSPNPEVNIGSPSAPVGVTYQGNANGTTLNYLQNINHNPLDTGDNLSIPANQSGYLQTWWGFPTWRETLSPFWLDPTVQINMIEGQPAGLGYIPANSALPAGTPLPAMTALYHNTNPQPFNDGFGSPSVFFPLNGGVPPALWSQYSWEDDLIMTGVRSFDIKAYDNSLAAYADLGWGDDLRLYQFYVNFPGVVIPAAPPVLAGTPPVTIWPPVNPAVNPLGQYYNTLTQTFAHEGRMPPLVEDNVFDAQYGAVPAGYYAAPNNTYTGNIGDDNPQVVRLRRVWDSWSTEYTQAPGTGVNNTSGFPAGPPMRRRSIPRTRRPTRRRCGASRSRSA